MNPNMMDIIIHCDKRTEIIRSGNQQMPIRDWQRLKKHSASLNRNWITRPIHVTTSEHIESHLRHVCGDHIITFTGTKVRKPVSNSPNYRITQTVSMYSYPFQHLSNDLYKPYTGTMWESVWHRYRI